MRQEKCDFCDGRIKSTVRNLERFIGGQYAPFPENLGQRVAFHELENQESRRAALLQVIDSGDVLMTERG